MNKLRRRLGIAAVPVFSGIAYYSYIDWKFKEMKKIKQLSEQYLIDGMILLDSPVTSENKYIAYYRYLKPHLIAHFKKVTNNTFNISNLDTYPMPSDGKIYQMSSHDDKIPELPKLTTSSYLSQAILCWICDPKLAYTHFGSSQTHFKLKLLISPAWAFFGDNFKPKHMYELKGVDQSWHIVNLPNTKEYKPGRPIPWGAHFDGGDEGIFKKKGLPPLNVTNTPNNNNDNSSIDSTSEQSPSLSVDEKLLFITLRQLAVLFYCETPGDLTPARGVTGFYPQSHLVFLEGLKNHFSSINNTTNHAYTTTTSWNFWSFLIPNLNLVPTTSISSSKTVLSTVTSNTIPWNIHNSAIKEWGHLHAKNSFNSNDGGEKGIAAYCNKIINWFTYTTGLLTLQSVRIIDTNDLKVPLTQITIKDDKILLVNGLMAYTTMFASEFMDNGEIRSLQNCRISFNGKSAAGKTQSQSNTTGSTTVSNTTSKDDLSSFEVEDQGLLIEFIRNLPKNSPLRKLVKAPINYVSEVERYHNENFNHYNSLSDDIYVSVLKLIFLSNESGATTTTVMKDFSTSTSSSSTTAAGNSSGLSASQVQSAAADSNETLSQEGVRTLLDSNSVDLNQFSTFKLKYKAVENSARVYSKLLKKYSSASN